jgi:hypothetical protein
MFKVSMLAVEQVHNVVEISFVCMAQKRKFGKGI